MAKKKAAEIKPGDTVLVPGDASHKGDWVKVESVEGKCPRSKAIVLHHAHPDRYFKAWAKRGYAPAIIAVKRKSGAIYILRCNESLPAR
jgi:hypothetical protein